LNFQRIFQKQSNIKFHENSSIESRVVPRGRRKDGRTGMMKLIVVFRNFAKSAEKRSFIRGLHSGWYLLQKLQQSAQAVRQCDSSRTYGETSRFRQKQTLSATSASSQQGAEAIS
jgi:hypothetical protein